jgi:hypothetical protein
MKTTTKIKKLASKYNEIVNDYTDIFYNQMFENSPTIDDVYWIGGAIGQICGIGDYFIDFDMIKLSVDYRVSFDDWSTYYWKEIESEVEYNYEHYVKVEKGYELIGK